MKSWSRRDLSIINIDQNSLVIACDSCAGVGAKSGDTVKISPYYAGKFTARVALTEVICSGAWPIALTNGVTAEMKPTGQEIIRGIHAELANAGLKDILVNGSTEENFPSLLTGLAITVIGQAAAADLKFGSATAGDKLILWGKPSVGAEVDLDSAGFYDAVTHLLPLSGVKEIVPVGSKGIAYEVRALAALSQKVAQLYQTGIDYHKSAGPATCLVVLCDQTLVEQVLSYYPISTIIGEIL